MPVSKKIPSIDTSSKDTYSKDKQRGVVVSPPHGDPDPSLLETWEVLAKVGFDEKRREELITEFGKEKCLRCAKYTLSQSHVRSPRAYFLKGIQDNWDTSAAEKAEQAKQAVKKRATAGRKKEKEEEARLKAEEEKHEMIEAVKAGLSETERGSLREEAERKYRKDMGTSLNPNKKISETQLDIYENIILGEREEK